MSTELSMVARDAQARTVANELTRTYLEEVCDADQRTKHSHECDWSMRDFVQAGIEDGGLHDNIFEMVGINAHDDPKFLHLVLHFAQVGGVRV